MLSPLAFAHSGKVVLTSNAPGKFCTGMTFDGEHLWVADHRADVLYAIDPATQTIARTIPSPGFWPMGLAWDGTHLWNVDQARGTIFRVDPVSGAVLEAIDAPSGKPEGLTWDGTTLWVSDARAKKIMRIDLSDGTAVKTVTAPSKSANGLTFDGTYLWCSDRMSDELYMIDPESGEPRLIVDAPGNFARGMAWDGSHLWCVDYESDELHRIVRDDDETYVLTDTRKATITFTHEVKVSGPPDRGLHELETYLAIPRDMPQQKVLSVFFSPAVEGSAGAAVGDGSSFVRPESVRLEQDRWEQPVQVFTYRDVSSGMGVESVMRVEAEISAIRYFIFPDRCGTLEDVPADIRERWTANGSKYQMDDPYIQDLAQEIVGDETNCYFVARRIFDHCRETLEYKLEGGWNVAPVVLQRGTGSCSEYTFSFIALCRAAGLPARYVGAIVVRGDDASLDDVFHRWPEVYLPGYGWVPIDPQAGDKDTPRDRAAAIGGLSNRFLITTQGGGDSEFLGWYYNYNQAYGTDPKVEVSVECFGEWEPKQ